MDIKTYLKDRAESVNSFLDTYFKDKFDGIPTELHESMRYSLLAGGKRLRPVLVMASYEACGGNALDVIQPASALEAVHTYSLIHDDLPAMDDDDLRRGRPTNHKVFGEAMAILAGDGLLTEAFLMVLNTKGIVTERLSDACRELSVASGPRGMVGGQAKDILSESAIPDAETLRYIHSKKTGALIASSVRIGGILAGADVNTMEALTSYGLSIGHAFQIVDDILDIKGDEAVIGKPVGSDQAKGKMTYPALYGIEASQQKARELSLGALDAIKDFSQAADPLRAIAEYLLDRTH